MTAADAWMTAACLAWACIPVSWVFAGLAYASGNGRIGIACAFAYPGFLVLLGASCASMSARSPQDRK